MYDKAVSQFELGRADEAILTMGRAVQLNKFHAKAAHNLGVYTLAKISHVAATMVELALGVKASQMPLSIFHQWLSVQNILKGHASKWQRRPWLGGAGATGSLPGAAPAGAVRRALARVSPRPHAVESRGAGVAAGGVRRVQAA